MFTATVEQRVKIFVLTHLVRANPNYQIRIHLKIFCEIRLDLVQAHPLAVQSVFTFGGDFHCPNIILCERLVGLAARLRKLERETRFEEGCGNDEDDEEHEGEVEQRSDIYFTQRHEP
jgi:hypothetical protein